MVNTSEEKKNVEVPVADIPKTLAACQSDEQAVQDFLGRETLFLNAMLMSMGLKPADVPDDKFAKALAMSSETRAETIFSTLRVKNTSFMRGKEEKTDA
jgi:hypothetical protein